MVDLFKRLVFKVPVKQLPLILISLLALLPYPLLENLLSVSLLCSGHLILFVLFKLHFLILNLVLFKLKLLLLLDYKLKLFRFQKLRVIVLRSLILILLLFGDKREPDIVVKLLRLCGPSIELLQSIPNFVIVFYILKVNPPLLIEQDVSMVADDLLSLMLSQ